MFNHRLEQESQTSGLRAKCGPHKVFMQPAPLSADIAFVFQDDFKKNLFQRSKYRYPLLFADSKTANSKRNLRFLAQLRVEIAVLVFTVLDLSET